jgi:hypothetical protein
MIYIIDEGKPRDLSDAQQNISSVLISLGKYSFQPQLQTS